MGRSWFVAMVWLSSLRPPGCSPAEAQSLRLFAAVAAAVGCVPRGQRALLDADMLELIDRSACLVEPVVCGVLCSSSRACAVTRSKHVQRRVRSLLANSASARPCGRSFAPWAAHSELLLSLHCDSCSWMIGTFLLLFTLQRDVSPCSLTYFCMYSILGHILRVRIQRLRNPQC